jgi:nitrogenase-stabilizing/protective protein
MDELTLDEAMDDLVSAEDFLDFFGIEYDASVVQVNRLHILQRYHNYLSKSVLPEVEAANHVRLLHTSILLVCQALRRAWPRGLCWNGVIN